MTLFAVRTADMDLEFHQIERRYEGLRRTSAERERRLCGSLAELGQQTPVVVVAAGGEADRYVLVDGYKRVRALQRLRQDTVRAVCWGLSELEALLLERLMRTTEGDSPLEQGWLLRELRDRFHLGLEELARRFDKSASWVSRRLGLVNDLPVTVQDKVRTGAIPAHAAMKHLVPLARAKREDSERLCAALAPLRPSTRQVAQICDAFTVGDEKARALLLADPGLFLRAQAEAQRPAAPAEQSAVKLLLSDFGALGGVARRAHRRLRDGAAQRLAPAERLEVSHCVRQAKADLTGLWARSDKDLDNAG
jgi:ParB/RepB/Spo0J family partition protein